jgi:hypothetical protein
MLLNYLFGFICSSTVLAFVVLKSIELSQIISLGMYSSSYMKFKNIDSATFWIESKCSAAIITKKRG